MSGSDAMHSEMPGFSPGRPSGEREPLLDMIFDRRPLPPGAPPEMHDLARMLAIAAGPAQPGELAGEATALAAFARLASPANVSPAASRPARRRLTRRPARARLPLAAALVTAAAGLGSMTAAYVGVLPTPIQHFAHVAMGAPAPDHDDVRGPSGLTSTHSRVMTPGPAASTTPRPSHSAARTSAPGGVNRDQPVALPHRRWLVGPTCTPRAVPAQNLVTPSSSPAKNVVTPSPAKNVVTPSPAKNVVTPSSSPTKAATPGPSPSATASGGSAGLPQPSASAGCQASDTEIVIPPNP